MSVPKDTVQCYQITPNEPTADEPKAYDPTESSALLLSDEEKDRLVNAIDEDALKKARQELERDLDRASGVEVAAATPPVTLNDVEAEVVQDEQAVDTEVGEEQVVDEEVYEEDDTANLEANEPAMNVATYAATTNATTSGTQNSLATTGSVAAAASSLLQLIGSLLPTGSSSGSSSASGTTGVPATTAADATGLTTSAGAPRIQSVGPAPTERPLGDATTVIDLADRDEMDDDMFPLTAEKSWFTRDSHRRYLNFSPVIQEFAHKGTAAFGGRLVFEIGHVKACDLLFTVALQIRLGHWFPPNIVQQIQAGLLRYEDPNDAWFYANALGTAMIAKAEFLLEDQVLETVDGDFANVFGLLYSDINTQFGVGVDANAKTSIASLKNWNPARVFPTANGIISCILPFHFQRIRLRNAFPLLSCKEGTVRVAITLRPFYQCVRRAVPAVPPVCEDTPLGKTFTFLNTLDQPVTVTASTTVPEFEDVRLVTYGMLVDGKLRDALLRAPFDRLYRDLQTFRFTEPQKYLATVPQGGTVKLQLPLEVNGPLEEIVWFIRRKAVNIQNEWTNYSNTLEFEYDGTEQTPPIFYPLQSMLVHATLQVNGTNFIDADGDFFRREVSARHRGGIVAYNSFVYGYTFAQNPAQQNPSGWLNASRSSDVRLRLEIRPPGGSEDLEFEVAVYCLSLNWVRFQNGIVNRVFSS